MRLAGSWEEDGGMSGLRDEEAEAVRGWLAHNHFGHVSESRGGSTVFARQDVWERDGTLVRLTRDRDGRWRCELSRNNADLWLDVDRVAVALGCEATVPVERLAQVALSMNDRVFSALSSTRRHSP
jgi:hypothetical protein